tara:strand:+ start:271 stop:453 length:183 start_codon:yes stop_codon:yes gene_type:complete
MSKDMSDHIDDYVRSKVGHTNWAFISGLKKEEVAKLEKDEKGYVEDNIFIFFEEMEVEDE